MLSPQVIWLHKSSFLLAVFSFWLALTVSICGAAHPAFPRFLVSQGSQWHYLDTGAGQGTAWRAVHSSDGKWKNGRAELGYGDGDESTVIQDGPAAARQQPPTSVDRSK